MTIYVQLFQQDAYGGLTMFSDEENRCRHKQQEYCRNLGKACDPGIGSFYEAEAVIVGRTRQGIRIAR